MLKSTEKHRKRKGKINEDISSLGIIIRSSEQDSILSAG